MGSEECYKKGHEAIGAHVLFILINLYQQTAMRLNKAIYLKN